MPAVARGHQGGTLGGGKWTLTFKVNLVPRSYTLFGQAEDSYGVFGDLVATTLTVQ